MEATDGKRDRKLLGSDLNFRKCVYELRANGQGRQFRLMWSGSYTRLGEDRRTEAGEKGEGRETERVLYVHFHYA